MIRALLRTVDHDQDSKKVDVPETPGETVSTVATHPEKNLIRLQLRNNEALREIDEAGRTELESLLTIIEGNKGDVLLHQGIRNMEQYFILDGMLKRVVSNAQGKEMILRFATEGDME